jgi:hypothetical protein
VHHQHTKHQGLKHVKLHSPAPTLLLLPWLGASWCLLPLLLLLLLLLASLLLLLLPRLLLLLPCLGSCCYLGGCSGRCCLALALLNLHRE